MRSRGLILALACVGLSATAQIGTTTARQVKDHVGEPQRDSSLAVKKPPDGWPKAGLSAVAFHTVFRYY